jgi:hypothetical protein
MVGREGSMVISVVLKGDIPMIEKIITDATVRHRRTLTSAK